MAGRRGRPPHRQAFLLRPPVVVPPADPVVIGCGKTFLARAPRHAAVRRRYSVDFERCDRMLRRLGASCLDDSHDAEVRELLRVDLLPIPAPP